MYQSQCGSCAPGSDNSIISALVNCFRNLTVSPTLKTHLAVLLFNIRSLQPQGKTVTEHHTLSSDPTQAEA